MAGYKEGQEVFVKKLKKNGVIEKVNTGGKYIVTVGSISISVKEDDIKEVEFGKNVRPKRPLVNTPNRIHRKGKSSNKLDLHGYTRDQAREELENFISEAILADHDFVDIIHGVGNGILKQMIIMALPEYSCVKRFETLFNNPGTTRAFLG